MAKRNRTQAEMREIIGRGESVFFRQRDGGLRVISRLEDIPDDAEMAKNSDEPGAVGAAEASIDEQIAALQRAKASLKPATPAKPEPAEAGAAKQKADAEAMQKLEAEAKARSEADIAARKKAEDDAKKGK